MNIVLKFVVGWPSNDNDIFDLLLEEFSQLDDLILYDIEDTYANLYFKVLPSISIPIHLCDTYVFRFMWHFNGNASIVRMYNFC
jgi:hypothetical protein